MRRCLIWIGDEDGRWDRDSEWGSGAAEEGGVGVVSV
jgi:hypothetical protein